MKIALALTHQFISRSTPQHLFLLTCGTQGASADAAHAALDSAHGGVWGLARVLRLEHAGLGTQSTDASRGLRDAAARFALASSGGTKEAEQACGAGASCWGFL